MCACVCVIEMFDRALCALESGHRSFGSARCIRTLSVCLREWRPASLQRYREANCILITKPSNTRVRQLPSTPRNTVNGAVKCVFSLLLALKQSAS